VKDVRAQMAEGVITPELIEEMKSKKGLRLRVDNALFNEYATRDNIRKFVDGIGDTNPLYRDEEYAKGTRYGSLIAPPSFVFSVLAGVQFGWRGLAGYHSSSDMEFYKPIKAGQKVIPEEIYVGFEGPKQSGFNSWPTSMSSQSGVPVLLFSSARTLLAYTVSY
jgi:acyl dehydratase